ALAQRRPLCLSERKLQCELHHAACLGCLNLSEIRRTDVVVRQHEVHIVEYVEELRAKLQIHGLTNRNHLDRGEVPLLKGWTVQRIAPNVSELSCLRLLERAGIEPALRRPYLGPAGTSSGIWIANEIRAAAEESGDFRRASLQ